MLRNAAPLLQLVIAPSVVIAIIWLARKNNAPTVTEVTQLARMPIADLRDPEIEVLLRAAFKRANAVIVTCEDKRAEHRRVEISDRTTLDVLSESFSIATDDAHWPTYPYPGITYVTVTFDGPYRPNFIFGCSNIVIGIGHAHNNRGSLRRSELHKVYVSGTFVKRLGDILGLKAVGDASHR